MRIVKPLQGLSVIFVLALTGCATQTGTMGSLVSRVHAGSVMSAGAQKTGDTVFVTSASVIRGGKPFTERPGLLVEVHTPKVTFKVLGNPQVVDREVAADFAEKFAQSLDHTLVSLWGDSVQPKLDIALVIIPEQFSISDRQKKELNHYRLMPVGSPWAASPLR